MAAATTAGGRGVMCATPRPAGPPRDKVSEPLAYVRLLAAPFQRLSASREMEKRALQSHLLGAVSG